MKCGECETIEDGTRCGQEQPNVTHRVPLNIISSARLREVEFRSRQPVVLRTEYEIVEKEESSSKPAGIELAAGREGIGTYTKDWQRPKKGRRVSRRRK